MAKFSSGENFPLYGIDVVFVMSMIHAATEIMIKEVEIKPHGSYIWLSWKTPEYLPANYVLQFSLTQESSGVVYAKMKWLLQSQSIFCMIQDVWPGSSCKLNLKAVYNPAALDEGITKLIGPDDYAGKRIN